MQSLHVYVKGVWLTKVKARGEVSVNCNVGLIRQQLWLAGLFFAVGDQMR